MIRPFHQWSTKHVFHVFLVSMAMSKGDTTWTFAINLTENPNTALRGGTGRLTRRKYQNRLLNRSNRKY